MYCSDVVYVSPPTTIINIYYEARWELGERYTTPNVHATFINRTTSLMMKHWCGRTHTFTSRSSTLHTNVLYVCVSHF